MSAKMNEGSMCEECGSLVIDKAKHRRFHQNVVTVKDSTVARRQPRWLGDADPGVVDGYNDHG